MVNKNTNKQCTNINSHQPSHPISPRPWGSADTTKILIAFSNNSSHGRHCNDVPDNDARQWCYSKSYFVKLVQFNCDAINSIFKPCPIIAAIISQLGVTNISGLGQVMGVASKQLAGKADGKAISAIVKELLTPQ